MGGNHQRALEEESPPPAKEAPESAGDSDTNGAKEEPEPPPTVVDVDATEDGDAAENGGDSSPDDPPPPTPPLPPTEEESPVDHDEQKDPGEAEAEDSGEPTGDEPVAAAAAGVDEAPSDGEESGDAPGDASIAEESLQVIEEIAKVEGETPEEVVEELHEEAEDLEYFEEELDEVGDDVVMAEEIAQEIAEEMGEDADVPMDVPEDLSGKGTIATDVAVYDLSSPVKVSFEIDPFLPGDWVGLYPFDAAYHDYDSDTLRVPHPSVEWLFLCGSHDCDGSIDSGESSLEFHRVKEGKWKVFLLRDSWGQSDGAEKSYLVIAESETFVVGSGEFDEGSGSLLYRVANGQLSNATVAGITALACIVVFLFIGWKLSKRRDSRGHAVPASPVELAEQGEWT